MFNTARLHQGSVTTYGQTNSSGNVTNCQIFSTNKRTLEKLIFVNEYVIVTNTHGCTGRSAV